ncbi:MAG: DUF4139 domain-containing protein [Bacteroidia bacterium]|nr:DUF4139 domain-containing protein [Bacteroidia bacterium]
MGLIAADTEQRTPSTITNVTVFLNQAQVTRIAKVNLQPGVTSLVLDKLSNQINPNSIQVKVDGKVTLLSVLVREGSATPNEKPKEVKMLEDSLQSINHALNQFKADKETIVHQKDLMLSNKNVGSTQTGVRADELEDLMVLYKRKLNEFKEDWFKLTQLENQYNTYKKQIEEQLNKLQGDPNENAPEIVITVKALSAIENTSIEINYLVNNASWKPFYDVRVKDTKNDLQLVSKAYITQGTGENWKNVILKLSTANPNEGGCKPVLNPNYVYFNQYGINNAAATDAVTISSRKPLIESGAAPTQKQEIAYSTGIAQTQQNAVNIEFVVTSAYTIPSDHIPHQVDLTVTNLKATYAYGAVPKLDKDAFVTAKVAGNDLVNQVSGEANIYFDGTFVGKTFINGTTSDSMLISLGRDKRIQIQRIQLKDFSSKNISGSTQKELNTWEISLRNTRKEPITIIVEDQIPVSTDKEIEVKLQNNGGAEFDETTGKLLWMLTLEPEKSVSVKFSFEVKYPKGKIITGY